MVEAVDPLRFDFPYGNDGPRRFSDAAGSYAVPDAQTNANDVEVYAHSLGEIVTAAIDADLRVEQLHEYVAADNNPHSILTADPDGMYRWRRDGELLPVMYGLRARRPPYQQLHPAG